MSHTLTFVFSPIIMLDKNTGPAILTAVSHVGRIYISPLRRNRRLNDEPNSKIRREIYD